MFRTRVRRTGNSLSCSIPKALAIHLGIQEGTEVELELSDGGFQVAIVREKERFCLPYTENELISDLTKRKAYPDLLEVR